MADENVYRRGQAIDCPACGLESVVQVKARLDGWENLGDWFLCGLCGHHLAAVSNAAPAGSDEPSDEATSRLAAFLDAETSPSAPVTLTRDGDAAFCKDCLHFLRHPFVSRCLLHDRATEPMRDCAGFARCPEGTEDEEAEA